MLKITNHKYPLSKATIWKYKWESARSESKKDLKEDGEASERRSASLAKSTGNTTSEKLLHCTNLLRLLIGWALCVALLLKYFSVHLSRTQRSLFALHHHTHSSFHSRWTTLSVSVSVNCVSLLHGILREKPKKKTLVTKRIYYGTNGTLTFIHTIQPRKIKQEPFCGLTKQHVSNVEHFIKGFFFFF